VTSGLHPFLAWLRAQIAALRAEAEASHSDDTAEFDAVLAQCEAHTKLLDLIEQSAVPEIKLTPEADETDFVAIFLDYKMGDFIDAVGLAYQHHPGYAEQVAAYKATPHQFQIAKADDELSRRRNPTSPR